jgi:pyridoxal phosphate enzyme (YggS family)
MPERHDMAEPESLAARLTETMQRVAAAAAEAGRDADELTTVVVTKFHPAQLVRELHALGVRHVGENRHQEAQQKAEELGDLDLTWHFVGQLQSNKAKQALGYARVIHSVDRPSLVDAIAAEQIEVFLQVNLTGDPARGGVEPDMVEALAERVASSGGLRLLGVMAVAPLDEEPRRAFARLRTASELVTAIVPDARFISAGMSGDFREAILEGATHLRIGSAITGNRPARP